MEYIVGAPALEGDLATLGRSGIGCASESPHVAQAVALIGSGAAFGLSTAPVGRRRPYREASGFALVELMAVIFIVGTLAGIVIFASSGISSQAEIAECTADATTVQNAISAYDSTTGGTPTVTASLLTSGGSPYLKSFPSSPGFSISIVSGIEMIAAPSSSAPAAYGTAGVCWGHTPVADSARAPTPTSTTTPTP